MLSFRFNGPKSKINILAFKNTYPSNAAVCPIARLEAYYIPNGEEPGDTTLKDMQIWRIKKHHLEIIIYFSSFHAPDDQTWNIVRRNSAFQTATSQYYKIILKCLSFFGQFKSLVSTHLLPSNWQQLNLKNYWQMEYRHSFTTKKRSVRCTLKACLCFSSEENKSRRKIMI